MTEQRQRLDVVVVGGGPAGLSGALTLARARRAVLVIDAGEQRNRSAAALHGLITREGLSPNEMLSLGRAEVERFGGSVVDGRVVALAGREGAFEVTLEDGRVLGARRLLVATGLVDELPMLPGLRELWGTDVINCPYLHGYEVRDQPIGVLGGESKSIHLAQMFRQWSSDVTLFLNTSQRPSAEHAEALAARKIGVIEGEVVALETEAGRLRGVRLKTGVVVPRRVLVVAPRFVARGGPLLAGIGLRMSEQPTAGGGNGERIEADVSGRTTVAGVWAAGNVAELAAWVPGAARAGVMAGAAINNDLIAEDIRLAVESAKAGRRRKFGGAIVNAASAVEHLRTGTPEVTVDGLLDPTQVAAIAEALKTSKSTILTMGDCNIGDLGGKVIGDALAYNTTLKELWLFHDQIGDAGARSIGKALRTACSLTMLCLNGNQIGDAGAESIGDALKGPTSLEKLGLGYNYIGDVGANAIGDALVSNTSVTTLNLYNNQIGNAGAKALGDALHANTSLKSLGLQRNQIGDAGAEAMRASIAHNTTLTALYFEGNPASPASQADLEAAFCVPRR